MEPQDAVELAREAVMAALLIGAPVLLAGLLAGLLIGFLQALTQVQEQTVAFVPKLAVMALVLLLTLPWTFSQLIDYTRELLENIPARL